MYATFTDGSPVVELLIFCATFAACLTLVQWKPAASAIDRVLGRAAVFLRKRIFLIDDVDTEQRRLDLIRIGFGLVTLFRNVGNLATAWELGDPVVVVATAAASLLSGFLMLGVMAPLSAGLLGILINTIFDPIAETSTLASIIMSMCCIALAMAPAGRSLSVDALILQSDTGWGQGVASGLRSGGTVDARACGHRQRRADAVLRRHQPVVWASALTSGKLGAWHDQRLGVHQSCDDSQLACLRGQVV